MENNKPAAESETIKPTNPPAKKNRSGFSKTIILLNLIVTILLLIIIFVVGERYYIFVKHIKKIGIVEQVQQMKLITAELQDIQAKHQIELQNIMENIKRIHQYPELLPIAESYASVKTANTILLTNGDPKTAIQLLQIAEQDISPYPAYDLLKQIIAKDITKLQTYAKFNDESLLAKLDELNQKITNLPQIITLPTTSQPTKTNTQSNKPSVWYNFGETLQHALQGIVLVQNNKEPTPPLLPMNQLINLRLNIQFKLNQAEWAVMYKKPDIYKLCLDDTETWLRVYFPESVLTDHNILQNLRELRTVSFQATIPTVNDSLMALKNVLAQFLAQRTQPITPISQSIIPANFSTLSPEPLDKDKQRSNNSQSIRTGR